LTKAIWTQLHLTNTKPLLLKWINFKKVGPD
jgi:hypothetical protein